MSTSAVRVQGAPRRTLGVAALVALFAAGLLAVSGTGADDPRIGDPAGAGRLSPVEPLFGWGNWPRIFEFGSLALTVGFVAAFGRLSLRSGWLHPGLMLTIALTGVGITFEPLANWACYCAYDPELHHLPVSWPYVSLAPVVQPIVNILGYPYYLLIPALPAFVLWRTLAKRRTASAWLHRHPLRALFVAGYGAGVVFDLLAQFLLFPTGVLVWTQIAGPAIRSGEATQYPVLTAAVWPVLTATTAVLLWRDDAGRTAAARLAGRLRPFRRRSRLGEIAVAWAILSGAYLVWIGFFGAIRVSGEAKTLARPWRFPEAKVFDPQGYYEDAGEPGPYFAGPWSPR